jgi:hypothetical protein
MSTYVFRHRAKAPAQAGSETLDHLAWLVGGGLLAFLVPFLLADVLELQRDLYYGIYALFTIVLFAGWARSTGRTFRPLLRRRLPLAIVLGLVTAGVAALLVLRAEDASARPDGLELVGAVVWRGIVYGAADGLLLSAFPILVVFAALARFRQGLLGTLAVGAAALVASLAMTAAYHAGYSDFRSTKVAKPVAGDVVWSVPTLVTLNPVGAPIAHAGMHVTAVLHSYETDLFLPPHE